MFGYSAAVSFLKKLAAYLEQKELIPEDCVRPERHFPLYWLAPVVDLGVRRVRLSCILSGGDGHGVNSKLYLYPRISKPLVLILPILSLPLLKRLNGKEPPVRLARIEGRNVIEKGHYGIRLAAFLNREYVLARVMEYDYASLKKRMFVQLNMYGGIVGVTGEEKGTCSYYGVCPENADVLINRHNVPVEKSIAFVPFEPAAGMDQGGV